MQHQNPLISIVTPVYNGSQYIETLIRSVLEQTYQPLEHIIIDDGSKDNGATVEILKRYPHLRWWTRENKGAYPTINEGLRASRGELVTVICADDLYATKTALADAMELWEGGRRVDAIYGNTVWVDEKGEELDRQSPQSVPVCLYRYYPAISHCSLLVRREFMLKRELLFDEKLVYSADYDWFLNLVKAGCRLRHVRKPIAKFRQHVQQRSRDVNPGRVKEQEIIRERHGRLNPVVLWGVNKWWRLVKAKNLLMRRGPRACWQAVSQKVFGAAEDRKTS